MYMLPVSLVTLRLSCVLTCRLPLRFASACQPCQPERASRDAPGAVGERYVLEPLVHLELLRRLWNRKFGDEPETGNRKVPERPESGKSYLFGGISV